MMVIFSPVLPNARIGISPGFTGAACNDEFAARLAAAAALLKNVLRRMQASLSRTGGIKNDLGAPKQRDCFACLLAGNRRIPNLRGAAAMRSHGFA
jgi:hypothetical protein